MEFLPVISKKTNEPMPDIYQFNVTTMIPDFFFPCCWRKRDMDVPRLR